MKKPTHSSAENEELKDAPLLRSLQHVDLFKAPEGYFDDLSSAIQNKISQGDAPKTSTVYSWKPVFAIVSVLVIALMIGYFKKEAGNTEKMQVATMEEQFSCDDLIESNYYLEIDELLIAEAMEDADATSLTTDTISDLEIEDYLIQSADEILLTNEL
ncbi:MAG: hypothetical protein IPJ86_12145 [Bacteroidetes bacterium]|nr:hypothetical protein [Bacteroidota bacterium]